MSITISVILDVISRNRKTSGSVRTFKVSCCIIFEMNSSISAARFEYIFSVKPVKPRGINIGRVRLVYV